MGFREESERRSMPHSWIDCLGGRAGERRLVLERMSGVKVVIHDDVSDSGSARGYCGWRTRQAKRAQRAGRAARADSRGRVDAMLEICGVQYPTYKADSRVKISAMRPLADPNPLHVLTDRRDGLTYADVLHTLNYGATTS